jgi:hypothetical protein
MPQDVATLFDNDDDVVIASSIKSRRSRHGSSSDASRPPTSESEGVFDANEDNEDDDEFPAHISTSSQKSKQPKAAQVITSTILLLFY